MVDAMGGRRDSAEGRKISALFARKGNEGMKHQVWKRFAAMALTCLVMASSFAGAASAAPKDEKWAERAAYAAKKAGTEQVKTIQWTARVTESVKGTTVRNLRNPSDPLIGKTAETKISKGTTVTVIQRDYHAEAGVSQCMLSSGGQIYIKNAYLEFLTPICTGRYGDYSKQTILGFVNNQAIKSSTKYMIWVSLDKQRVYVFKGRNRNWSLLKRFKTSTGMAEYPTLDQSFKSKYKIQKKALEVNGLYWYCFVHGSGFHKFPGPGASQALGIQPVSHSCIRLRQKHAQYIFKKIPLDTRVFIW